MFGSKIPGYRLRDYVLQEAAVRLSRVVGMRRAMKPLWNRWRGLLGDEAALMGFLESVRRIEDWGDAATQWLAAEGASFQQRSGALSDTERVSGLRKLSAMAVIGQWGVLAHGPVKSELYRLARDHYLAAERLAHGDRFQRCPFEWNGRRYWANIHYPATAAGSYPGVLIVHGVDDTKEDYLAAELQLQAAGFAVCTIDGPGQAEALLLDRLYWPVDYDNFVIDIVDQLRRDHRFDQRRLALLGVSWGGFWIYKAAAKRPAIAALFDLGGSTHARYEDLPFVLKARFCEISGIQEKSEIDAVSPQLVLSAADLVGVRSAVRIVHGARDRLVPLRDKEQLFASLRSAGASDVTMRVFADGDHCCSNRADEVRADWLAFFARVLQVDMLPA